jgi:hypothetical protein
MENQDLKSLISREELYTLRDCDKACESTIFTKSRNKVWIQVGQGTKRKVCTPWDKMISWYGKHVSIVLCELTHDLCAICVYVG